LLGVQISTILSSDLEPGIHIIDWIPKQLTNGFYFFQIQSETGDGSVYRETKRMLYVEEY